MPILATVKARLYNSPPKQIDNKPTKQIVILYGNQDTFAQTKQQNMQGDKKQASKIYKSTAVAATQAKQKAKAIVMRDKPDVPNLRNRVGPAVE
jgi:hypothetical protein